MPWSPQRFLAEGLRRGRDHKALMEAIRQISRMQRQRPVLPTLLTLGHLACRTQISYEYLRDIIARNTGHPPYRSFRITKRSGGLRVISVPSPQLMKVQSWLTTHVLNKVQPHPTSYAFSPGSSIADCARQHAGATWLVKIDIADFFGSITEIQVFRVFQMLGYNKLVSFELARLCTILPIVSAKHKLKPWKTKFPRKPIDYYSEQLIGRLPQGAPTSPMLANLAMRDIDEELQHLADSLKLVYTRYSDDITFSTKGKFSRTAASAVIKQTTAILKRRGLFPNRAKTAVIHPGARKIVLGLLVDQEQPRLSRKFRDRLRQHLYYLETRGITAHLEARGFDSAGGLYRHLRGLIDYANMVDQPYAQKQLLRLQALPWGSTLNASS
ncbi:reverse transcriptase family protein [Parapusillimonas granuli]|uniref:RNA-directed DNA polymerase n=1 Tax=Parapusillimonas granuli TaxID=380911 RepID=A0A853G169_9BURK|nr:reverse transcriptase family protein [Parapusillimonas granuli]MBB5217188.1 RNA-directed DNA polymerase [Parapusillimonas granuli]NYT51018.1 RNA-directed DNA polymerase [Parapusillimonas granuli]